MIVDWHAHVYPPEMAKERRWGGASPLTIENLLEAHEKAGIDLCVVSNTIKSPPFVPSIDSGQALSLVEGLPEGFFRSLREFAVTREFAQSHAKCHKSFQSSGRIISCRYSTKTWSSRRSSGKNRKASPTVAARAAKICRSATAPTPRPTSSRLCWNSHDPKPSPSAAAGNRRIIPTATAPTAVWSNRKNARRAPTVNLGAISIEPVRATGRSPLRFERLERIELI